MKLFTCLRGQVWDLPTTHEKDARDASKEDATHPCYTIENLATTLAHFYCHYISLVLERF
jgi:hypothetical protein